MRPKVVHKKTCELFEVVKKPATELIKKNGSVIKTEKDSEFFVKQLRGSGTVLKCVCDPKDIKFIEQQAAQNSLSIDTYNGTVRNKPVYDGDSSPYIRRELAIRNYGELERENRVYAKNGDKNDFRIENQKILGVHF